MSNSTTIGPVHTATVAGQQRHGETLFPAVYSWEASAFDLSAACQWVRERADALGQEATRHGAILFRGFPLRTAEQFDAFVTAFGWAPFLYEESLSNAVRVNRTPRVFTANEAPPSVPIFFHHEMAQTPRYPARLFFFCEQPAETGGATSLCRSDVLCERLSAACPPFVAEVAAKGLRYSNVMPGAMDPNSGMGRSWQSTLRAATRAEAEQRLATLGYSWQWLDDDNLRVTTPVLPGVMCLPDGRRTFFNQLIAAFCGWKDQRNDPSKAITFGDGSPLDGTAVATAVRLAEELAFEVNWQTGDVALVDNRVAMHARRPFTGTRKLLAAMA